MRDRFEVGFRREMIKLTSKIDISKLRALMIFREYEETIDEVLKDILKEIEGLHVLYIVVKSPESLPPNFSKLIHLRYLKIIGSFPHPKMILPSALSRFYHLKFLDLGGFLVTYQLPKDISRLINLCHFFVEENELHSSIPEVRKMKCLQDLKQFCVQKKSVRFELRELGELTELGGELSVHNLERMATKEEAAEAKLEYKRDLKELRLLWGTDQQHSTEYDVLDGLEPHNNLRALSITNHGGTTGPRWLCGDISIKKAGVSPPRGCVLEHPSTFWEAIASHVTNIGGVTDKSFVLLKRIILRDLPEFIEWDQVANAHSFSRLEHIVCKDCLNLCAVPFLDCSVSYANLTNFCIVGCPKLSLPPMPHRSTLKSLEVRLGSIGLSYDEGNMDINGYSGGLAFHNLNKVKRMKIRDMSHISLTELSKLKSLTTLYVKRCSVTCHGLQDLTWLQYLRVEHSGNFLQCPIEAARTIKAFHVSLRSLEISGESGMQSMALLSNLTFLSDLKLVDCENLTVDGFNPLIIVNLDNLAVYNTGACPSRSISFLGIGGSKDQAIIACRLLPVERTYIGLHLSGACCSHLHPPRRYPREVRIQA